MSKEVAKISEKALADQQKLLGELAGNVEGGQEDLGAESFVIPRLSIIQGTSPQVKEAKPEYDPDAKEGDIYDVSMGQGFGKEIQFIAVLSSPVLMEWAAKRGDGLRGIHKFHSEIRNNAERNEKGALVLPNGNILRETAQFFGYNLAAPEGPRKSFIPMASTFYKKSKDWNSMPQYDPDIPTVGEAARKLWYRVYNLTTVDDSNDEGDWKTWKITRGPSIIERLGGDADKLKEFVAEVDAFQKALKSDSVRADLSSMENDGGSGGGGNQASGGSDGNDDI